MNPPNWLAQTSDAGLGCYVHIPFCDRICPYCDFAVALYRNAPMQRYLAALIKELTDSVRTGPVQTLYLGGGTPSALPAVALRRLLAAVFTRFQTAPGSIECTLEANPARNVDDLSAWLQAGVNRLSIGVQSFDASDLHRLGRSHSQTQAVDFYRAARAAGFANISIDLIAGVPGQTQASFERTLHTAIELAVDHISVYGLTIEEGTPFATWHHRDPAAFVNDDALAAMLDRAHHLLADVGFAHYELSNFARPGFESAHNTGYWRQRDCVAFGMSAAGYDDGLRYRNHKDFERYCAAIESGTSACADEERLDAGARVGEAAMLALRTARGIDSEEFLQRFRVRITEAFADATKRCMASGLLEQDARGLRLTGRGRLLANTVCAEFLEPQRTNMVTR